MQAGDSGRQVERAGEGEGGFVEGAEGGDAGQHEGFAAGGAEEGFGQGAGGATGGQQDQAVRALERVRRAPQPVGGDGVEERSTCGGRV